MDFELSEVHKSIQQSLREWANKKIKPKAKDWDEHEDFPLDVVKELGSLGFLGFIFPEEYGGAGGDYVGYALAIEEITAVDASIGLVMASHNSLCTNHIFIAGTEEQKRKYVPKLATGEWLGAWALTEPNSGSDAASMQTTAKKDGNEWVLNGTKMFITQGTVGDVFVILAITDREKGNHGISAFVVEKGTTGFSQQKIKNKLGMRASDTAELIFDNCRIPLGNLIGNENKGFSDSMKILDGGRISIAALGVGIARGAYELSLQYAKERKQFGKRIADFQSIAFNLADMAMKVEASRLLTLKAATLKDQGKFTKIESAMAKLFAGETATWCCERGIQIHGGYGFMNEYDIARFYRDCKLCDIGEGTSEIQRFVISRELTKE